MSSRMLRSEIRSEIFDLPVPSRHGKERQKEERNYSLFSCPIPPVPEMHLLRPREILIEPGEKDAHHSLSLKPTCPPQTHLPPTRRGKSRSRLIALRTR